MRIKKNIKYHNEREEICINIIELLKRNLCLLLNNYPEKSV